MSEKNSRTSTDRVWLDATEKLAFLRHYRPRRVNASLSAAKREYFIVNLARSGEWIERRCSIFYFRHGQKKNEISWTWFIFDMVKKKWKLQKTTFWVYKLTHFCKWTDPYLCLIWGTKNPSLCVLYFVFFVLRRFFSTKIHEVWLLLCVLFAQASVRRPCMSNVPFTFF